MFPLPGVLPERMSDYFSSFHSLQKNKILVAVVKTATGFYNRIIAFSVSPVKGLSHFL